MQSTSVDSHPPGSFTASQRRRLKLFIQPKSISSRPKVSLGTKNQATAVAQSAVSSLHATQPPPAVQLDSRNCSSNDEQPFLGSPQAQEGGRSGDGLPPHLRGPRWEGQPQHIALIMDGNGRWASQRGLPPSRGHEAGVAALQTAVQCCLRWRIPALTAYVFSAENWKRPREEVGSILSLAERVLGQELAVLGRQGVRLNFVGSRTGLPASLLDVLHRAAERTKHNSSLYLTVALNYGGRQDIAAAVGKHYSLHGEESVLQAISSNTALGVLPEEFRDPDLLIRTGGEMRLSNFLLWNLAYTELYFSNILWPDFTSRDLETAILEYCSRTRRFGGRESAAGMELSAGVTV